MNTLYIHIGTHKTGTSMIQKTINHNLQMLIDKGVSGVLNAHRAKEVSTLTAVNYELIEKISDFTNNELSHYDNTNINKYIMGVEGYSGDTKLGYTNSDVVANTLKQITSNLKNIDNVKIIVFLRRQDEFIESLYNQMIKQGDCYSFVEFLDTLPQDSFNWSKLINNYANEFGSENIIIKRYGKKYQDTSTSIIDQFYSALDISPYNYYPAHNVNESLSRDGFEIMKILNKNIPDETWNSRKVLQVNMPKSKDEKFTFFDTIEKKRAYMNLFKESNSLVSKLYFNEDDLFDEDINTLPYSGLAMDSIITLFFKLIFNYDKRFTNVDNNMNEIVKIIQQAVK